MPTLNNTEEKTGSKAEGLCISGDEEHVPILYWEQQDMLRIAFPEGCRYQTEYKLEFPADLRFLCQLRSASPAKAELMYEPGICGLSNSSTIISQ